MAFTDPIATTAPPFTVKSAAHPLAPASYFSWSTAKLRPTNSWWQNLIIPHYDSGNYNGKTATFPYAQWPQADGKGFTVSYFGAETGDRDVQARSITLSGAKDISLGINETISTREVLDYTDLGVSLRFNHASGSMTSHFVQGMAFNGGIFSTATPKITIEGAILEINGVSPGSASLTNVTKLKVKTNRYNREWVIYASSALSFSLNGASLTAIAPYSGRIQMAVLNAASDEAVYDSASTAMLTGGTVTATYSGNTGTMAFAFSTVGSGAPLVFTMPHHQDLMPGASYTSVSLATLRGTMKALQASTWTLNESLTTISWTTPNPIPASKYGDIKTALDIEKNSLYDTVGNGWGSSPYYYGKYLAKMAQLILIAEQIGETATANSIASNIKTQLANYLAATPTGSAGVNGSGYKNTLLYQGGTTWRGISTENGLADMGADFGSGRFNDHHFHYGYWIYAAAVVARNDAAWRSNNKAAIDSLVRDIANPSHTDTYFPKFRHKDWFAGHSWAGGLVGIDVGPGQESTSEAINAWYGTYLWGLATSNADVSNLGRLMLATEVRSAKRYWHITDQSDIYPSPFSDNGTAVIVRTHKVAVETYFGSRAEYFYGIQSLPYTPATELYMDTAWVTRSYPLASVNIPIAATGNPQDTGWNSVMYGMHAVIDSAAAYSESLSMPLTQLTNTADVQYGPDIDNGHTKANALYWASTRTLSQGGGATSTNTTLSVSPTSSATAGATVTVSSTISPSNAAGTVTFKDGTSTLGTASVSSGTASITTTSLSTGAHSLTAEFTSSNTANYTNSTSSAVSYTITAAGGGGSVTSNASQTPYIPLSRGPIGEFTYTSVNNANYTVLPSDSLVAFTALTAARTVTLPGPAAVQQGRQFVIKDESGACSAGNSITIAATVDGVVNPKLTSAYAKLYLYSNGTNWLSLPS